uniref:Uncharacterized protein n=1 Tax=Anguilla anguilla TaxID=7936 RepID=A0A0E9U575_ANGAN
MNLVQFAVRKTHNTTGKITSSPNCSHFYQLLC